MSINSLKLPLFWVLLAIIVSCSSKNKPIIVSVPEFDDFRLVDQNGVNYKCFLISDSIIHVKIPLGSDMTSLKPVFYKDGVEVKGISTELSKQGKLWSNFSDFENPVQYLIISDDGTENLYTINVYDLPVLIIDTPDGQTINSRKKRTKGCEVSIFESDSIEFIGFAGIRGRGNWSWDYSPQKSYNIKFEKKRDILGMNKSKHWVLLANGYMDVTQLHNAVAFEMARMTDYPWIPSSAFVELILNGKHVGLYQLCEKIEVEENKINIKDTGGTSYLLETIYHPTQKDMYFTTSFFNTTGWDSKDSICWEVKYPKEDEMTESLLCMIKEDVNHMESLIANDDSLKSGIYSKYFDIESAINWMLVEEATLNEEAVRTKNVYMYKAEDGKFYLGPPWDFDAFSFGDGIINCPITQNGALYFPQLLNDPNFIKRVKEKWNIYKQIWKEKIPKFIREEAGTIRKSAIRNEKMYPCWFRAEYEKGNRELHWYNPNKDYDDYVDEFIQKLNNHIDYLDNYICNL